MAALNLATIIIVFILNYGNVHAWTNEELELFDLVEEVNKNFYEVMGVDQSATSAEIRRAYRKLSLQLHPDKNKEEDAEIRFRELVAVYEVLKDDEKRQNYDLVLVNGLPDWKQPVYYYRRVRKLGLIELAVLLFLILTIGHFIVIWAIYLERRFELEEIFRSHKEKIERKSKKKQKKGASEDELDDILQETLQTVPKPMWRDLLPCKVTRGVVASVLVLPQLAAVIKLQMTKPKQVEESSGDEQEEENVKRTKRRHHVDPMPDVVPELACSGNKPVVYMDLEAEYERKAEEQQLEEQRRKKAGTKWDDEELALLAKAVAKFPGGTQKRWEKIADMIGRPVAEVTKMSKTLKTDCVRTVDPSAQGVTGAEHFTMKKGSLVSDQDITTQEGYAENSYPESLARLKKKNKTTKVQNTAERTLQIAQQQETVDLSQSVPITSHTPVNVNGGAAVNSSDSQDSSLWTQNQQKALELAIKLYPKGTEERWEKIAEQIIGKNKEECMLRFKYLAELVKKRKQQQTAS